jgi:hypothetical protein
MKIMYESLALDYSTVFSIQEAIRRLGPEYANIRVEFDGDHTWIGNVKPRSRLPTSSIKLRPGALSNLTHLRSSSESGAGATMQDESIGAVWLLYHQDDTPIALLIKQMIAKLVKAQAEYYAGRYKFPEEEEFNRALNYYRIDTKLWAGWGNRLPLLAERSHHDDK